MPGPPQAVEASNEGMKKLLLHSQLHYQSKGQHTTAITTVWSESSRTFPGSCTTDDS